MIELAGCVILDEQGKVLLIHRNTPTLTQWEVPGGKCEQGESAKAAAARELKEELGLDVGGLEMLGEANFEEAGKQFHYTWFLVGSFTGSPVAREEKHDDAQYFSLIDMDDQQLSSSAQLLKRIDPQKMLQ